MPFFFKTDFRIDTDNDFRFGISNGFLISDSLKFDWEWNSEYEYDAILSYRILSDLFINLKYDSDYKLGLGVLYRW